MSRPVGAGAALLVLTAAQCPPAGPPPEPTVEGAPYSATLTIDADAEGRPVNRLLLGTNIQWVDRGDRLLKGGGEYDPKRLEMVDELAPTVIRYPGGSESDVFDWRASLGPQDERGSAEVYHRPGEEQEIVYGLPELLELCRRLGAEPLLTVNLNTGTAEDAAAWLRAVNVEGLRGSDGEPLPGARFWEIGNEPYLDNEIRPDWTIEPEEFAARATRAIRAMREVDPSISIGLPLRSDTIGTIPLPQQIEDFAEIVLQEVDAPIDWVSLHNAYFPFLWNPQENLGPSEVFQATMAAYRVVEEDFEHTRRLLRRYRPGEDIDLAVTEYAPLFGMGSERDSWIATLGGALYVADLLRLFTEQPDLLMATHWSLSGNWYFGTMANIMPWSLDAQPRPVFHVLRAFNEVLRGRLLPVEVDAPTFDSPQAGLVPAFDGTPLVTAVATRDGDRLQVLVINKDPTRPLRLRIPSLAAGDVLVQELTDDYLFDPGRRGDLGWEARPDQPAGGVYEVSPHSMLWVTLESVR